MRVWVHAVLLLFHAFTRPGALSRVSSFLSQGDHGGSLGLSLCSVLASEVVPAGLPYSDSFGNGWPKTVRTWEISMHGLFPPSLPSAISYNRGL